MKVLFLVTARGGSKGVSRKNIREIGGLPLIAYKIIAAKKCKYDKRIIVSTEDEEIAQISKKYGAEIPFIRPKELATDIANSIDVVKHAILWLEVNDPQKYEYICLLEPSSPFASYDDLNEALDLMVESNADTLLSVKATDVNTAFIHTLDARGRLSKFYYAIKELNSVRRQDMPTEYTMNGCMYIAKWEYFKENQSFHSENSMPYIMDEKNSIEIDSMFNYEMARFMVEKGIIDIEKWGYESSFSPDEYNMGK